MNQDLIREVYEKKLSKGFELEENDGQLVFLLNWIPKETSIELLDAGCGKGRYSAYLAGLGYSNLNAVDLYDQLQVPGTKYQTASIDQLPFPDKSFNFVFSNSVVFYVNPPSKALEEFYRVLKPGGRLMFTATNRWSMHSISRIIKRDIIRSSKVDHLNGVSFLSAGYYDRQLRRIGFQVLHRDGWKFSYFLYPRYWSVAMRLNRWLGLQLPQARTNISRSRLAGRIKSELAYHSVFLAQKPSDR